MEGNDCYKFSVIDWFVSTNNLPPITKILELGVNFGDVTNLMKKYFPEARIVGFEPVPEFFAEAIRRAYVKNKKSVSIYNMAVTSVHEYEDELCQTIRTEKKRLFIHQNVSNPGGTILSTTGDPINEKCYTINAYNTYTVTFSEALEISEFGDVDIVKMDCEGCERSNIGSMNIATLKRLRYIVGEYHNVRKFWDVINNSAIRETHRINLLGDQNLGAFFCERIESDDQPCLLHKEKEGVRKDWGVTWHTFKKDMIRPEDYRICANPRN
jgi:FkbM family methyltransferase